MSGRGDCGRVAWDSGPDALPGAGPRRKRALRELGIATVGDLLLTLPLRYEDRARFAPFPPVSGPGPVLLRGRVADILPDKFLPGRRRLTEARLEPAGEGGGLLAEPVALRWFNAWRARAQLAVGQELVVYGTLQQKGRGWVMWFPEFEVIEPGQGEGGGIHLGRVVPVHPAGAGLTPRVMRELVWEALERVAPETVPPPLWAEDGAVMSATAVERLRALHFPSEEGEAERARRSLARDEALAVQTALLLRRGRNRAAEAPPRAGDGRLVRRFLEGLPYPLTGAQRRVIEEILADLRAPHPMTRLLHGDVGSGKTVVAFCAMLAAVEAGWRAALMAPTQVLAEQHYANWQAMTGGLGVRAGLRTGARSGDGGLPLFDGGGEPEVLIGTHALLYEEELPGVGLVVVDEQHKFGVMQRSRLAAMAGRPDYLVMTATPIPRTLALTLYGDLDVSVLDELPPGRKPAQTVVRKKTELERFVEFLRRELAAGRQAYLVFPLIEESEKSGARAAKREFEHWSRALAPHACGLMHGRLKPAEKAEVIEGFRAGRIRALVSTTVIEVGVDVPNATVMAVFDAERFGLAQLHQLRGRVGRGGQPSYCVLVPSGEDAAALERLAVLETTSDGFKLAEADLAFRGAGQVFGTAQSGAGGFRALDPAAAGAGDLLAGARARAREILEADPELMRPENRWLAGAARRALAQWEKERAEADAGGAALGA